jgi:hypothetical protein
MNFREIFRSARNIDNLIHPSTKSVTQTSRCTSIGRALSVARKQTDCGLAGFADQHHFLTGVISTWPDLLQTRSSNSTALSRRVQTADADRKTKRALQTLLHPEMLGRAFQVLALDKNVDSGAPPLSGFKFAREPNAALGVRNPND